LLNIFNDIFVLLDREKMATIRKKLVIVGDGACGNEFSTKYL
jgi:hypothetical protein